MKIFKSTMMAAALFATVALVMPSAHATTKSEDYLIGSGDYSSLCRQDNPANVNIGGVCFKWSGSKTSVTVKIADLASGDQVGFYWQWYNANDDYLDDGTTDPVTGDPNIIFGTGCSTQSIAAPSAARGIRIWLDQAFGPLDCPNGFGIATNGTVTVTY